MNLSVTRWDTKGNFQWEFILDHDSHFQNYNDVFVKDYCVDDKENIYILGSIEILDRQFFMRRWVPLCKRAFVLCLSKNKKVRWVKFFRDGFDNQNIVSHDENIYVISTSSYNGRIWEGPSNCIRCLNSYTGRKLWIKSINTSFFDFVHSDEHGAYLLTYEDNKTRILSCYDSKARKKWSCEIPDPYAPPYATLPRNQWNRKGSSCNSNDDHVYLSLSSFILDTENAKMFNQTYHLYSINREGKIEWTQTNKPQESTSIVGIKCQNNLLCIVSQTNTEELASKNAFQKELKGETDLLLSILDAQGVEKWKTYIGGSGLEPYYGSALNNSGKKVCFFDFQKDRIVIGCSTSSQDFPINEDCPVNFYPDAEEGEISSLTPLYNVVCVFDTNGKLRWSTYTSTDSETINTKNYLSDIRRFLCHHNSGNKIVAMKVNGEHIYLLEDTNNPNIVLNNPKQQTLSFDALQDHGYYVLDILSAYSLK
jgi:hypothetical protein